MLIVGALALLYAFCYGTGSLAELGQTIDPKTGESYFDAAQGKYDATLYIDIQGFNNILMYCGLAMILLAVVLYITSCHSRRNYYVSNFVATGLCAGGNIVMSVMLMVMNGIWMGKFLNVDFEAWADYYQRRQDRFEGIMEITWHYSTSTAWFIIGFAVYAIVIIASVALILNLVWKIKLMKGEKELLSKSKELLTGGELA